MAVTKPTRAVKTTISVMRGLVSSSQSAAEARASGSTESVHGVAAQSSGRVAALQPARRRGSSGGARAGRGA